MTQEAREELEALVTSCGGVLSPQRLVDAARDPASALHKLFEWDPDRQSELYLLYRAHEIIRKVRVRIMPRGDAKSIRVRAYVSLGSDRGAEGVYRPILKVLGDDAQRAELLGQARSEMRTFRRKYAVLSELASVLGAIDEVLDQ